MANTFKFGNGNWAVKEDYALAYNDENGNFKPLPFDFTRASTATRVNKDGLIENVPSGKPRIDFTDNTSGHLLLEPSRTNVALYSEEFDNAAWVKLSQGDGSIPIVTTNYAISPDGTMNASRLQCNLNGGNTTNDRSWLYQSTTTISGDNSFSLYVKNNSNQEITFTLSNGASTTVVILPDEKWHRLSTVRSGNGQPRIGLIGGVGASDTADLLIWGAQLEEGSYATSIIKTENSSVTRIVEYANDAGNSQVFDNDTGVWFIDLERMGLESGRAMMLANSSGSEQLRIHFDPSEVIRFRDGKASFATIGGNISMGVGIRKKLALKIDGTTLKVFADGSQIGSNYTRPTAFDIHSMYAAEDAFKLFDVRFYNTALSDSELQALTS